MTILLGAGATAILLRAARAAPPGQASTGQINGKIYLKGAKPKLARIMMDQDPVCASVHPQPVYAEDGEVNSDGAVPNAFLYIKSGLQQSNFPTPSQPVILDQRGCVYVPHVLGAMVGQVLKVVSSDPTTHNVHFMPKENREYNASQIPGAAPLVMRFTRPEIMIPVKCNQHPWMKAYIGVVSNPFYAVTGDDGAFTIKGLPPGDYTVAAWTATFGTQEQKVTVRAGQPATADFTFSTQ
ncbi:MAG TPA: carboxypeptidase regulatory-like domain-containing protein [Terriglobia bacterium]